MKTKPKQQVKHHSQSIKKYGQLVPRCRHISKTKMSAEQPSSSDNQQSEKRSYQTPSSSSGGRNLMSSFHDFQDEYASFSLNKKISSYREQVNAELHKKALLQDFYRVASHPITWKHELDSQLFLYSLTLNERYPYYASLCHTQQPTLLTGMALLTFIPLRSKYISLLFYLCFFFFSFVLSGWTKRSSIPLLGLSLLLSGSVIFTFNYKWNYPRISSPLTRAEHRSNDE
jgi:hypothetical protein